MTTQVGRHRVSSQISQSHTSNHKYDDEDVSRKLARRKSRPCIVATVTAAFCAILMWAWNVHQRSSVNIASLCEGYISKMPQSDKVIDIDIGTFNSVLSREADLLLTFDPFDLTKITDTMEQYPYVIADYNGTGYFLQNSASKDCSSFNHFVNFADDKLRTLLMHENCNSTEALPGAMRCATPDSHELLKIPVQVRRLCDILKLRGFTKVNHLKIDAQGSDFTIVKDLFENCPHVQVDSMKVECQLYSHTIPLYLTDNDCSRIEQYLKMKFPNVVIAREMNVCWSAEYNLLVSNLTRSETTV